MSEYIKFSEMRDSQLVRIICNAPHDVITEIIKAPGFDANNMEVEMFINGVEISPTEAWDAIRKANSNLVLRKAEELLEERSEEVLEKFRDTMGELETVVNEMRKKVVREILPEVDR